MKTKTKMRKEAVKILRDNADFFAIGTMEQISEANLDAFDGGEKVILAIVRV